MDATLRCGLEILEVNAAVEEELSEKYILQLIKII